jgi:uncharacterized protein YndB with AHSA1/START domain
MARVAVSRVVNAPQRDVWALLSDVANAGRWNKAWTEIELTSPQTHGIGTTFAAHTETGDTYEFAVCEWVAPERIAFCPVRDEAEEEYSITLESHAFQLKPAENESTLLELSANARPRGLRGRFLATFFWPGHQRSGLNFALERVAEIFEGDGSTEEHDTGFETLTE